MSEAISREEKIESADKVLSETWLVYEGARPIKVNRSKLAGSCMYFECLLQGHLKESTQRVIDIMVGDLSSFEAFELVVRFAETGTTLDETKERKVYIEAVQLAILWNYEKFICTVERHLINLIDFETLIDLTALAERHPNHLGDLLKACDKFALCLDEGTRLIRWPKCPFNDHKEHHILSCKDLNEPNDDTWD